MVDFSGRQLHLKAMMLFSFAVARILFFKILPDIGSTVKAGCNWTKLKVNSKSTGISHLRGIICVILQNKQNNVTVINFHKFV